MKNAIVVHGWGGSPDEPLHQWVQKELESQGYVVTVPEMPETEEPKIDAWVSALTAAAHDISVDTVFVGHSIGCQTILRFLAGQPADVKVDRCIFIAPWTHLIMENVEAPEIAIPWIETPLDMASARAHMINGCEAFFSDDDPYVPLTEKEVFERELGARTMVLHGKGHFEAHDGVDALPEMFMA